MENVFEIVCWALYDTSFNWNEFSNISYYSKFYKPTKDFIHLKSVLIGIFAF